MAERTFIIGAPIDQSRSFIWQFFAHEGWTCTPNPNGGIHLSRGKKGLSVVVGALAGRNFYLSHDVDFSTGPQGGDHRGLPLLLGQGDGRRGHRRSQVLLGAQRVRQ